jgi:hypothetical protein
VNTQSIDCRKVVFAAQTEGIGLECPGDFCFDDERKTIYVWLPGMSGPDAIRIQRGEQGGPKVWGWNGDEEKPSLTPSIHVLGKWHGYLTNGRLTSC